MTDHLSHRRLEDEELQARMRLARFDQKAYVAPYRSIMADQIQRAALERRWKLAQERLQAMRRQQSRGG